MKSGLAAALLLLSGCAAHAGGADPAGITQPTEPSEGTPSQVASADTVCTGFASQGMKEHVAFVSITTGRVELGPEVPSELFADATSLGVQGAAIVTCANTVVRVSTKDGKVDTTDVPCDVVTGDDRGLLVAMEGQLARYETFDAIAQHAPVATTSVPKSARLATASDGSLLASDHETDTVLRLTATGTQTGSVILDGYDGMVLGLAAAGDRIVIAPWYTEGGLITFDAKGKRLQTITLPQQNVQLHGLACR